MASVLRHGNACLLRSYVEPLDVPSEGYAPQRARVLAPRDDRLFPLHFQRRVTAERLQLGFEELPGGHVPMLARPRELAKRLAEPSAGAA